MPIAVMVGFGTRTWGEPVYRQMLTRMTDEALEEELRHILRKLENTPNRPHYEDVWKRDCLRHEFTRRGLIPDWRL